MRPTRPETSVTDYQSTLRINPEELRYDLHSGGSLKLRNFRHIACPLKKKLNSTDISVHTVTYLTIK
jgi:hypothetical protein